jgi:hypothetical protein
MHASRTELLIFIKVCLIRGIAKKKPKIFWLYNIAMRRWKIFFSLPVMPTVARDLP